MKKLVLAVPIILISCLASCNRQSPTIIDRPPVINSYEPAASSIQALVGDTLSFTVDAFDPEGRSLDFAFMMADSIVSRSPRWQCVVADTGSTHVVCTVSDGGQQVEVAWNLYRAFPLNLPPVIDYYEPQDLNPSIIVGGSMVFGIRAYDPEGKAVSYAYTVNDTLVGNERRYTYYSSYVGDVQVVGMASDGEQVSRMTWVLKVTQIPDSIPPAPVTITSVTSGANAGEIDVDWIAVGDDGMSGLPDQYQIRTSSVPITSEFEWNRASDRPGEPAPAAPGDTMHTVVGGLIPANNVYVAVRAIDEFGNLSPLGNSPGTEVKGMEIYGVVKDALTTAPLGGIEVSIAGDVDTTASDGSFAFLQLPQQTNSIRLRDEPDDSSYGNYFDVDSAYSVRNKENLELFMLPNVLLQTDYYSDFLVFFKIMTDTRSNPFGNNLRRWEFPLQVYVPPLTRKGIDYRAEVVDALNLWETMSGLHLFDVVSSPPAVGVSIAYEDSTYPREKFEVVEWSTDMYPIKGLIHLKTNYDSRTLSSLRVIIRHEVGHSLGLKHSSDPNHIMVGGRVPLVEVPSADEIKVLTTLYHLPRGEDMANHLFN
jgi:hypothetical protein